MLEVIEKLLILQERDRKIFQLEDELAHVPFEKQQIQSKYDGIKKQLESAKLAVQKLESELKEKDLEVESKKELIEKYSVQQFQTKKNEEYQALTKEISTCKAQITQIEDRELELMEQKEQAEKRVSEAKAEEAEVKKNIDSRLADLNEREGKLKKELEELQSNRAELASAVDESVRNRYERLLKSKGSNVVVGIHKGVCGGCHMQLSRQTVVSTHAAQEIVNCTNCGRILYYTRDMDLLAAE